MSKNVSGIPLSRLACYAMAEEGGKAWFVRSQANGLYEFDKTENRTKLLMRFPGFPVDKGFLYLAIEKAGSILVLAPASASEIVLYDLAADRAEYLEIAPVEDERKVKYIGSCRFLNCYRHGDSVYLFGFEYPAVLKLDVNTKQILYLTDWVKEVEQRITKIYVTMGYVSDYVIAGDFVWALCECANAVLRLDLRTDEIKIVDIYSDLDVRCGICFDGNFWVTGYNENVNKLLEYDAQFVFKKETEICSSQKNGDEYSLSLQDNLWEIYPILDLGERFFLFSVYPRHVYEYDKTSQEVRICPAFEGLLEIRDEKFHEMGILALRRKGNLVCFITGNDFLWNEYDLERGTITRYEVRAGEDEEFLQIKSKFMAERVILEGEMLWELGYKLTLSRFLEHIFSMSKVEADDKKREDREDIKGYEKNSRGYQLYEAIRRKI